MPCETREYYMRRCYVESEKSRMSNRGLFGGKRGTVDVWAGDASAGRSRRAIQNGVEGNAVTMLVRVPASQDAVPIYEWHRIKMADIPLTPNVFLRLLIWKARVKLSLLLYGFTNPSQLLRPCALPQRPEIGESLLDVTGRSAHTPSGRISDISEYNTIKYQNNGCLGSSVLAGSCVATWMLPIKYVRILVRVRYGLFRFIRDYHPFTSGLGQNVYVSR